MYADYYVRVVFVSSKVYALGVHVTFSSYYETIYTDGVGGKDIFEFNIVYI